MQILAIIATLTLVIALGSGAASVSIIKKNVPAHAYAGATFMIISVIAGFIAGIIGLIWGVLFFFVV